MDNAEEHPKEYMGKALSSISLDRCFYMRYCSLVVCSILVSQYMSLIEVGTGRCEVFYSERRLSLSQVGISLAWLILLTFENLPRNVQLSFQ